MRASLLWLFLLALVAGCQSPEAPRANPALAGTPSLLANLPPSAFTSFPSSNDIPRQWLQPPTDSFELGPGDVLEIEIFGEANSLGTTTVGPDGKIYYDLLPGTFVWGLTLEQAKEKIENEFARFLVRKPEVGVSLKAAASQRVWLLGDVTSPGVYPLSVPMTILEAVSWAGGPATNNLAGSFIIRDGQRVPLDLNRLFEEGDLSQNIYLQPDDFVFLQAAKNQEVFVMGAVLAPNAIPHKRGLSLATAIAYAGGPLPYASMSQVAIVRGSLSRPSIATVNFNRIRQGELTDVELEPGDLIYVPLSTFYKVEILLNSVLDTFVRTVAVNEGQNAVVRDRAGVSPTIPLVPIAPPAPAP